MMVRGCLVSLMLLCGVASALLLHTLVTPVWVVAADTPIGALPYVQSLPLDPAVANSSSSSNSIASSLRPLPVFALGTLRYCAADGGVCAPKSSSPSGFGAETSCERSATAIRHMYIACITCTALALICFGAGGVLLGRPAFTSDPARLGKVDYDVSDADNQSVKSPSATESKATANRRARSNEPVPSAGNSNNNSTDGIKTATGGVLRPAHGALSGPNSMSLQTGNDDEGNGGDSTAVVTVQPASVTAARLEARKQALVQHATRRMTRSVLPAVLGACLAWAATFVVMYMHEYWLHCGSSTVDNINSVSAQLGVSGSAERGVSVFLVLAASGCGLLVVLMLPCLRSQVAAAARAEFDDDDDKSSTGIGVDDNRPAEVEATAGRRSTLAPPPTDDMDMMSFSRDTDHMRVEPARSPPARSPVNGMEDSHHRRQPSTLIIESPDERDHL